MQEEIPIRDGDLPERIAAGTIIVSESFNGQKSAWGFEPGGGDVVDAGDSFELRKADAAYTSELLPKSAGFRIEETIFGTLIRR